MPPKQKRKCRRCQKTLSPKRQKLWYCYLCSVVVRHEQKDRAHRTAVEARYHLLPGEYDRMLAFQHGKCAICQRATGATKRLSVDHDHKLGLSREAVRGLLCGPCNQMLGHGRDDI